MATYLYHHPASDRRPIEQRTCDTCGQVFDVRIPSIGQGWTTCPACQTAQDMEAIRAMEQRQLWCPERGVYGHGLACRHMEGAPGA